MIFSLFIAPKIQGYGDSVDDPVVSRTLEQFGQPVQHNVVYYRSENILLNNTETRTIALPAAAASNWQMIIAKVVGRARINTTGTDTDGVTAITGKLPMFGTELYPGVGCISTYNVSSFQIEGLDDGTTVELFLARLAEDDDPLLDTNE